LEQLAAASVPACHVIRLPALFGANIKKNFIYDLINTIPSLLNAAKYNELSAKSQLIERCYTQQANGFYICDCPSAQRSVLCDEFERLGFSALDFTDSRAEYQFYNLANLWEHIGLAIKNEIPLLHLATEPICAAELHRVVKGTEFTNEIAQTPVRYDFRTKYAELFHGTGGYIADKQTVLGEIVEFVKKQMNKE
jgi:hypothetical protein